MLPTIARQTNEDIVTALSRRLDEVLILRQNYQDAVHLHGDQDKQAIAKLIDINTRELPQLRKLITDTRNAPRNGRIRKALAKLKRKLENALSGIGTERESDVSAAREVELEAAVNGAKTNSQRRRAGAQKAQLLRDREVIRKHHEPSETKKRARKKEIAKRKKTWRFINKALRTGSQLSACAHNSAEL
jgi:hypothetical protein